MLLKKVLLNLPMFNREMMDQPRIGENFRKVMQTNTGCAVIMAGSDSDDKPKGEKVSHIEQIAESLEAFEIPYQVRICSAHKQLSKLRAIIEQYNDIGGLVTYIAVAAGTDALSGTLSYHALGPVISCSPDAPNESCLRNPPGSSNAYIAKPANVGRFVAQIYAGVNIRFRSRLQNSTAKKIGSLNQADNTIQKKYEERQRK